MIFVRMIWISLISLALANCSGGRSKTGAILGGVGGTSTCLSVGIDSPYAIAGCTLAGAFIGAEALYNDDYDVHNAQFVDHLNKGGSDTGYTNWYNKKTKNFGIIRVTNTYTEGPLVCKEYDETVNIKKSFPFLGYGSSAPHREVRFGKVCQLPDGRWFEHE